MQRAVWLVLLVLLPACAGTSTTTPTAQPATGATSFDLQFIDDMSAHHIGAIRDAQMAQTQIKRNELRQLAENIITGQTVQIKQMQEWRSLWFPKLPPATALPSMGGAHMAQTTTGDPDRDFMQAMIPHHQDAIKMAQAALQNAQHQELKDLAQRIIDGQTAEIKQMEEWLK